MKTIVFLLITLSFLFAQTNFDSKDVKQINEKLYDVHSKQPITGTIISKYKNGSTKETISVVNGIPNGISIGYYPTGIKRFEAFYKNGKFHGLSKIYYKNGNLHYKFTTNQDKLVGLIETFKEDGTFYKNITYEEFMAK